jgi:regulation of enolase protein 1 (concanavalin A-like superfamily)
MLYAHERAWAKLCLEYSPLREPMIVAVVTRDVSDDCNSFAVDGGHAWLRVSRIGRELAFHASADGSAWGLVRHFALEPSDELLAGFEAQSPLGEGCKAFFTDIRYEAKTLADIRSGE